MNNNELMKVIQDMNDQFSKELEIIKRNSTEILEIKSTNESHANRCNQLVEKISGFEKKNEVQEFSVRLVGTGSLHPASCPHPAMISEALRE